MDHCLSHWGVVDLDSLPFTLEVEVTRLKQLNRSISMHSDYLEGINLESILIVFRLTETVQLHDLSTRIALLGEENVDNLGSEGIDQEYGVVSEQEESLVDNEEVLVELDLPVDVVMGTDLRGHRLLPVVVPRGHRLVVGVELVEGLAELNVPVLP